MRWEYKKGNARVIKILTSAVLSASVHIRLACIFNYLRGLGGNDNIKDNNYYALALLLLLLRAASTASRAHACSYKYI